MKTKIYLTFLALISIFLLSNCSDDYLDKFPLDQPSDATFWSTQTELQLSVNALYTSLYFTDRSATHLPFQFLLDLVSDITWDRNLSAWKLLSQGLITPNEQTLIEGTWKSAYQTIGQANRLLANMEKAKDVTDPGVYANIEAEARFFRAYWYHYLTALYGDVPFTIEPLDIFNAELPRTSKSEIHNFIIEELDAAAAVLPEAYPETERGKITKGAALAIKAREALFNEDWDKAMAAAKNVIDMDIYSLYPDYEELFTYAAQNNNEEVLTIHFSRANQKTHETPVHVRGRLGSGFATKIPTQALIDSYQSIDGLRIDQSPLYDPTKPFENRDPRLHATCVVPGSIFLGYQFETHPDSLTCWDYNTDPPRRVTNLEVTHAYATFSGYQYRKYVSDEDREFRRQSELNIMLVRYAEVLLMYAEAKVEKGEIDETVYSAVNDVRKRAGMPEIANGKSPEELRRIIRQERKVEFAFEGLRFFDLRRWKLAEDVMPGVLYGRPLRDYESSFIPTFDENDVPHYDAYGDKLRQFDTRFFNPVKDYLWPIPQKERDINSNLGQNPVY
ncbi:MAG: RagB/SusD family nutrient uptake outer membrane protein [Cyclobacteriaceae bacterium]